MGRKMTKLDNSNKLFLHTLGNQVGRAKIKRNRDIKKNKFIKVRLNEFWASYIANGVEDSLENGEKEIIENTLNIIGVKKENCCDVLEDSHYESPFYPDNEYSNYVTYVFYQL